MSAALRWSLASVEEYLRQEMLAPVRHEFIGGVVYAMASARNAHNVISDNILISLGVRLRGRRCRPFGSNTKIRCASDKFVREVRRGIAAVLPLPEN